VHREESIGQNSLHKYLLGKIRKKLKVKSTASTSDKERGERGKERRRMKEGEWSVVENHEDRRPSILSRSVAVNITAAHWALSISYFIYLSLYIYLHSFSIEKMLLISCSDKTSCTVSSTVVDIQCTYI
jgi:hypothetical protein